MGKYGYYRDVGCKNWRESFQARKQNYKQRLSDEEKFHAGN